MPAYRYYAEERNRHADAGRSKLTADQVFGAVMALCEHWRMRPIEVHFHRKQRADQHPWSWYRPGRLRRTKRGSKHVPEHLDFEESMLNCRVVAHEVAHYRAYHEFESRRSVAVYAGRKPPAQLWHGPEHRALTDDAVAFLRDHGLIAETVEVPALEVRANATRDAETLRLALSIVGSRDVTALTKAERREIDRKLATAYLEQLPKTLVCPKCAKTLPSTAFGTRVFSRTPEGLPIKIGRQSRCGACRRLK